VRIYPLNGSHSKARRIIGARTLATPESIPIRCKSPHCSICCRGKRLNPFLLGGGWYYTTVKGPGDSTIRKTDSVDTLGRSPFSAFILLQWPMQIVWYLVIGLLCVTLPLSAAALTTSDSTKHLYDRVMEEFQHRDYDAALAGFRLFMELHGDSPLASSAQYWIGECEFRLGRFQEAVGSFEQVMARYPRSPKVPSATLKKAMAYDKLRMKNEARILFERVIVQFPHSTEAEAAKKALRE